MQNRCCLASDEQKSLGLSVVLQARKLAASGPVLRFKVKFSQTKAGLQLIRDIAGAAGLGMESLQ